MYDLNTGEVWIEKFHAKSFKRAEEKAIQMFIKDYDIEYPSDFKELGVFCAKQAEIIIGDLYDVEEF